MPNHFTIEVKFTGVPNRITIPATNEDDAVISLYQMLESNNQTKLVTGIKVIS